MGVLRFGGGGGGWVMEGLNVVVNLLTKSSVKGIEGLVANPPLVHVTSTKRTVRRTLGPSPTGSRQAVCASLLSHLFICGEHSRALEQL